MTFHRLPLLIVIGIIILALTGCRPGEQIPATRPAATDSFFYAVLGDSMLIDKWPGDGNETCGCGAASLFFQNQDEAFPEFAGRDIRSRFRPARIKSFATDGAKLDDLLTRQLPALLAEQPPPDLITLSIAGNDLALFMQKDLLQASIADLELFFQIFVEKLQQAGDRLNSLRTKNPDLRILVLNIYDPTDGYGYDFFRQKPLDQKNSIKIYYLLNRMNRELLRFSLANGYLPIDVHSHFLGHGIAVRHGRKSPFFRNDDQSFWYHDLMLIDVNRQGAHELRTLLVNALGEELSKKP